MASGTCGRCGASCALDEAGRLKDHFPNHQSQYDVDGNPLLCNGSGRFPGE